MYLSENYSLRNYLRPNFKIHTYFRPHIRLKRMTQSGKLYIFTKYSPKGPSSRYRTFQYIPYWTNHYEIKVHQLLGDWYFDKGVSFIQKINFLLTSVKERLNILNKIVPGDLVFIEYELFPYLNGFAEKKLHSRGISFILDYDDAIFHHYGHHKFFLIRLLLGKKIQSIIKYAAHVVTGSPYLTSFSQTYNTNTIEIPTSVDCNDYNQLIDGFDRGDNNIFVIGWLGSFATSNNLVIIRDAFAEFSRHHSVELWLMGFDESKKEIWNNLPVRYFKWSTMDEKKFLKSIDAGIMPLIENPYNHGKCGFKLIQYMAMGKATISTPMEANLKIDRNKSNFFAREKHEWLDAFRLVQEKLPYDSLIQNRSVVENYYNTPVNAAHYITLFNQLLEKSK